jgi:hypothetical protein
LKYLDLATKTRHSDKEGSEQRERLKSWLEQGEKVVQVTRISAGVSVKERRIWEGVEEAEEDWRRKLDRK